METCCRTSERDDGAEIDGEVKPIEEGLLHVVSLLLSDSTCVGELVRPCDSVTGIAERDIKGGATECDDIALEAARAHGHDEECRVSDPRIARNDAWMCSYGQRNLPE